MLLASFPPPTVGETSPPPPTPPPACEGRGENTTLAYRVRAARPEEADAIHDLTLAAYSEYSKTEAPSSALQETLRDVRERFWSGAFRVAVAETVDGRLVGAVRYRMDSDGLYFFRLGVHPDARRQGIARAFLDWLEEEAIRWRAGKLRCQVRLIVPRNVELYHSAGFEIVSQHIVIRHGVEVPTATMEKPLPVTSPVVSIENRENAAVAA